MPGTRTNAASPGVIAVRPGYETAVRLVLTNDDGIDSPGIRALCARLVHDGHEVTVVAPDADRSGASASIGRLLPDQGVPVREVRDFPVPARDVFAIAGPPGLAAMTACLGAFGECPDAVVSGINAGPNTGHAILHSGTVGAALTAQTFGTPGLAVSVDDTRPWRWETACGYVGDALERLTREPEGTVLNLNVPGRDPEDVRGVRWATLDRFGSVRLGVTGRERGRIQFELRDTGARLEPDSDTALLRAGFATLTRLVGVSLGSPDGMRGTKPGDIEVRDQRAQLDGAGAAP
jgi:5'-nucleotidase